MQLLSQKEIYIYIYIRGLVSDEEIARTGKGEVLDGGFLLSAFKVADALGSGGLSGAGMGLADGTLGSRGIGCYMECQGQTASRGRKRMDKEGRVACFLPSSMN